MALICWVESNQSIEYIGVAFVAIEMMGFSYDEKQWK